MKETEVTVDDMPAFPPEIWSKEKTKIYEFEKLIKRQKEELWLKKHIDKIIKK
jgi:hypothetical protein